MGKVSLAVPIDIHDPRVEVMGIDRVEWSRLGSLTTIYPTPTCSRS